MKYSYWFFDKCCTRAAAAGLRLRSAGVNTVRAAALALAALWLAACSGGNIEAPVGPGFVAADLWDDGLAEFNWYEGHEIRYGSPQPAEVIHILVSEHFLPRDHVKADDPGARGTYAVLKLNQVVAVQTGVYRYQQMTSHFWRRDDGRLLRFNLTSGDSCGNTWKDVRRNRHRPRRMDYRAQTYWDGMTDVRQVIELPDDGVFYDELPVWARALATEAGPGDETALQLAAGIIHPQADAIAFAPATARIEEARLEGHEGAWWRVTIDHAGGRDLLWLDPGWPHRLQRWDKADGGRLELQFSERLAYWELNQPQDRLSLPPSDPAAAPAAD